MLLYYWIKLYTSSDIYRLSVRCKTNFHFFLAVREISLFLFEKFEKSPGEILLFREEELARCARFCINIQFSKLKVNTSPMYNFSRTLMARCYCIWTCCSSDEGCRGPFLHRMWLDEELLRYPFRMRRSKRLYRGGHCACTRRPISVWITSPRQ